MTKELRKAIMDRSRLRNEYLKYPTRENFVNLKKRKNQCNLFAENPKKNISEEVERKESLQVTYFGISLNRF